MLYCNFFIDINYIYIYTIINLQFVKYFYNKYKNSYCHNTYFVELS